MKQRRKEFGAAPNLFRRLSSFSSSYFLGYSVLDFKYGAIWTHLVSILQNLSQDFLTQTIFIYILFAFTFKRVTQHPSFWQMNETKPKIRFPHLNFSLCPNMRNFKINKWRSNWKKSVENIYKDIPMFVCIVGDDYIYIKNIKSTAFWAMNADGKLIIL